MNSKMKAAISLVYIAFVGFAVNFFSYFGVYSVTSSMNSSSMSYESSSKTLLQACVDGTIKGGTFCFVLTIILAVAAFIVDLVIASKALKGQTPPSGVFGITIAFGVACFILAIIQLVIFTKLGSVSSEASTHGSKTTATVSTGVDFFFLYVGSFEAAILSVVGGGVGLKALEEPSETASAEESSTSSSTDGSDADSNSVKTAQTSEPSKKYVGDIIKFRFLSGTSLYKMKDGTATRCRIEGTDEFELLEINEQSNTGIIRRLSDEEIFEDVALALFIVKKSVASSIPDVPEKPTPAPAPAPIPAPAPEPTPAPSPEPTPEQSPTPAPAEQNDANKDEMNKIKLIREYKQLFDDGIITKEEFENKKKDLLK